MKATLSAIHFVFLLPRKIRLFTGAFPISILLILVTTIGARAADWRMEGAPIRFEVQLTSSPSTPEAGVIAIIPDGGLLPHPAPDPVVLDAGGKTLKSEVLWHSPRDGIAVVFEPPETGVANIYFRPASSFSHVGNRPGSLFKSSLLLMVKMGHASLNTAQQIPAEALQGGIRMGVVPNIGQRANQFGPDEDFSSYYAGWLKVSQAGKIYICTISCDGSLCLVEGKTAASWPGIHTRKEGGSGKYGTMVELTAGLHRVEYFHFKKTGETEANLCWRLPGEKLPHTLRVTDFVQSGEARITKAQNADGQAPAVINWSCDSYLWLRNYPWNLYSLRALTSDSVPPDTQFTWEPEPGMRVPGKSINWIFSSPNEHLVGLTVTQGKNSSHSSRIVYPGLTPSRATINSPNDRVEYRKALLARCQAVPPTQHPCAMWDEELWSILLNTVEPLAGLSLMQEVFERSWNDVLKRPVAERYRLEDIYFDLMRYSDKNAAESWLTKFEAADSTNRERRLQWQLTRVDYVLHNLNQPEAARKLALALKANAVGSNEIARVMIRQGDVERFIGEAEQAAKFYSGAQDILGKKSATVTKAPPTATKPTKSTGGKPVAEKSGGKGERLFAIAPSVDDWRKQAVREAAYYESLHNMLKERDIEEAKKTLETWEMEFPLSKLAGDYPIGEGEFYTTIGDFPRALRVLSAYRKNVEISNYLPQAMALECRCLIAMKRNDEFKTLALELIKRFPGHPSANEIQVQLDLLQGRRADDMQRLPEGTK